MWKGGQFGRYCGGPIATSTQLRNDASKIGFNKMKRVVLGESLPDRAWMNNVYKVHLLIGAL